MYVYTEDSETMHPVLSISGGDTEMSDFLAPEYQSSTKHLSFKLFPEIN